MKKPNNDALSSQLFLLNAMPGSNDFLTNAIRQHLKKIIEILENFEAKESSKILLDEISGMVGALHLAASTETADPENLKSDPEFYKHWLEQQLRLKNQILNENRDFVKAVLDSSLDMIQVFRSKRDEQGKIVDFVWISNNSISEKIYGDVIGKSLLQNNPGVIAAGIFDKFVSVVETGIPQHYEVAYTNEQFDGIFHQSAVKIEDDVVTSTSDITARKKAEQENAALNRKLLNQNRELESLNTELKTFYNIAVNDYQQTLRNLYLYLELVIKTDASKISDSSKANIRRAQSAIHKMKLLTDDIISYSKIIPQEDLPATVNIKDIVQTVLSELSDQVSEKNTIVEFYGDWPEITAYPLLIKLLMQHLIGNALKFAHENQPLQITFGYKIVPDEFITELKPQLFHAISVADNGIGFDQKNSDAVFGIFVKLHDKSQYRGSGVGLAVCRKIMEIHSGYIEAESNSGKGSIFTCYFPVIKSVNPDIV